MEELEQYWNERYASPEVPFSRLSEDQKKGLSEEIGFAWWKLSKKVDKLENDIFSSLFKRK